MSREIESNFIPDYWNEEKQCRHCDSFEVGDGVHICTDSGEEVPPDAHCDFFRSVD